MLNVKFSEVKSTHKGMPVMVRNLIEESIMFRKTGNWVYECIENADHLEFNLKNDNDIYVSIVSGYYSLTKTFENFEDANNLGYKLLKGNCKIQDGKLYLEVCKLEVLPGLQEEAEYAWKNNISRSFEKYFKRLD